MNQNCVFSHDVMAAIFVSKNNEMAAMFVSQTSPVAVELFSYVNAFFCSNKFGTGKMVVVVDDLSGQATAQVGFLRTCANYSRSLSDNRLLFAALTCNLFYCILPCPPVD